MLAAVFSSFFSDLRGCFTNVSLDECTEICAAAVAQDFCNLMDRQIRITKKIYRNLDSGFSQFFSVIHAVILFDDPLKLPGADKQVISHTGFGIVVHKVCAKETIDLKTYIFLCIIGVCRLITWCCIRNVGNHFQ